MGGGRKRKRRRRGLGIFSEHVQGLIECVKGTLPLQIGSSRAHTQKL